MRDINFFSPYIESKKLTTNKLTFTGAIVGGLLFIMIGLYTWNNIKIKNLNKEIAEMERFIHNESTISELKEINNLKHKLSIMKDYHKRLVEVNKKYDSQELIGTELINAIALSLPKNASIEILNISTENVQIQGFSGNRVSIAEFQHNLKETNLFKTVHVSDINQQSEEDIYNVFIINCYFKDVK
ncbi:hypothetical protein L21TH_0402 [Caldisalinibacter kiritimatiensis]|uniref:Type IV pilus biogenesis protein PilN n=1 Tax=Caldisalinibacter kiritimatiensis TaxID=1304284 RepID=R1CY70_9FIRM|nr:hypothetical protein L21TH_0402 [Caldisalinibacter kiritimatiensis]